MTWMTVVAWVAGSMLAVAATLALVRAARGPDTPNRAIALDVLVAVLIAALGVEAAYQRHTDTLPILVVLSLVGMVGTVSVARFAVERPDQDGDGAEGEGGPDDVGDGA